MTEYNFRVFEEWRSDYECRRHFLGTFSATAETESKAVEHVYKRVKRRFGRENDCGSTSHRYVIEAVK